MVVAVVVVRNTLLDRADVPVAAMIVPRNRDEAKTYIW